MAEQYAGALLYLVPVLVAAVVAFIVTRPEKDDSEPSPQETAVLPPARPAAVSRPYIPAQRTYQPLNRRANPSTVAPQPSPTLLHAALSSHFAAVAGAATSASAPASAKQPAVRPSRLVSIRRPARIPRRPLHRCPHKP
ncbi:hypothetical protein Dvina_45360 [Dactylosporangium vinaceum]|uniref:Uncharacterized protein n=1 Tax=Dactylosporangium vinaceum TaxID=53362 RepID=A0ABV5LZ38_9ACTN|nr:hypothetical protein [Dactylosporangium vinaceum]UAB95199.1 hypothetical protein Dvina_45360 [Dactylosporangium vinaceum]